MKTRQVLQRLVFSCVVLLMASRSYGGPIIIDGTDSNDHGFASGGVNFDGWAYMQAALQNLAGQLGGGIAHNVLNIGADPSLQAGLAIQSAFNGSGLPGAGWTLTSVQNAAVNTALGSLSTATTGILYLPTYGNANGDMTVGEMQSVNTNATNIAAFINAGGALFAQGESGAGAWGWLTTLIPGLIATDAGSGGIGADITLTAAGAAAFPGLSNADLADADPWHGFFSGNFGSLSVLGVSNLNGQSVALILGGGAGAVITPNPVVPEPGTMLLFGTGLAALYRRRRTILGQSQPAN